MNDRRECPHGRSYYEEEVPWEICGECRRVNENNKIEDLSIDVNHTSCLASGTIIPMPHVKRLFSPEGFLR